MNIEKYASYPHVPKVWGTEIVLVNNDFYCSKLMVLKPNFQCSLHKHRIKNESFFVLQGSVALETLWQDPDGESTIFETLNEGDSRFLPAGVYHRFWTLKPDTLMLEVSTPHSDDDVVRLQDSGPLATH